MTETYTPSPVNRMTHACEKITLPQTSFVDGDMFLHSIFPKPEGEVLEV